MRIFPRVERDDLNRKYFVSEGIIGNRAVLTFLEIGYVFGGYAPIRLGEDGKREKTLAQATEEFDKGGGRPFWD